MSIDKRMDSVIVQHIGNLLGENSSIFYWIHYYWEEGADPRTKGYPLVDLSGLGFFVIVIMSYLFIAFVLIPEIMRKRPGLTLTKTMITYNIILVSYYSRKLEQPRLQLNLAYKTIGLIREVLHAMTLLFFTISFIYLNKMIIFSFIS